MKNKTLIFVISLILNTNIHAHTLLLNIFDNKDNTITIEAGFDTGATAEGALIRLESLKSKEIIYKKRLPQESELRVQIPNEAYQVVLDAGSGHIITKIGIAPNNGFTKNKVFKKKIIDSPKIQEKELSLEAKTQISFALAFFLIFLSIFIGTKNTNKLIRELKKQTNITNN